LNFFFNIKINTGLYCATMPTMMTPEEIKERAIKNAFEEIEKALNEIKEGINQLDALREAKENTIGEKVVLRTNMNELIDKGTKLEQLINQY